jgi:hypothetical protein
MSAPNSGHSGDESSNDRGAAPAGQITLTRPRPNYARLLADYNLTVAEGLLQEPIDPKYANAWAHAKLDFEDTMDYLQDYSGLGEEMLPPGDTRTEYARVKNAIICLHDWLRLYQEIIKQPPPEGLLVIEQKLCERRDELNHLYQPEAHQSE